MNIIDRFKKGECKVRCINNSQAKLFLRICCLHDIYWAGCETMDETNWFIYGTKTIYSCNFCGYDGRDKLYFGDDYKNAISFKDFMEMYTNYFGNRLVR